MPEYSKSYPNHDLGSFYEGTEGRGRIDARMQALMGIVTAKSETVNGSLTKAKALFLESHHPAESFFPMSVGSALTFEDYDQLCHYLPEELRSDALAKRHEEIQQSHVDFEDLKSRFQEDIGILFRARRNGATLDDILTPSDRRLAVQTEIVNQQATACIENFRNEISKIIAESPTDDKTDDETTKLANAMRSISLHCRMTATELSDIRNINDEFNIKEEEEGNSPKRVSGTITITALAQTVVNSYVTEGRQKSIEEITKMEELLEDMEEQLQNMGLLLKNGIHEIGMARLSGDKRKVLSLAEVIDFGNQMPYFRSQTEKINLASAKALDTLHFVGAPNRSILRHSPPDTLKKAERDCNLPEDFCLTESILSDCV